MSFKLTKRNFLLRILFYLFKNHLTIIIKELKKRKRLNVKGPKINNKFLWFLHLSPFFILIDVTLYILLFL